MKKIRTFGRKALSLVLALIMMTSVMSITTFAATEEEKTEQYGFQLDADKVGGYRYYDAAGNEVSEGEHDVAISKAVYPTGTENIFDIELTVETDMDLNKSKEVALDTAVVLTIDLSGTMYRTGNKMDGDYYIEVAKAKALEFVDKYAAADPEGVETSAKRWLAVTRFDTDAAVVQNWVDVNTAAGLAAAKSAINGLSVHGGFDSYDDYVCTNFDGGVILTRNLLKQSKASKDFSWGIILSDGAPTVTVNNAGNAALNNTTVGTIKSSFWGNQEDADGNKYQNAKSGGGWTHYAEVMSTEKYMESLAEAGNVMIIGVGGLMNFRLFADAAKVGLSSYSSGTRTNDVKNNIGIFREKVSLLSGKTDAELKEMTTGDWMTMLAGVAKGSYVAATNTKALEDEFAAITAKITKAVDKKYKEADAWNATDPIGGSSTDCVEFLGFVNEAGNTVSYDDNSIFWNLLQSASTTDNNNVRTYKLKYRARLATEDAGFVSQQFYQTNGSTYLNYQEVTTNANGDPVVSDTRTVKFPIPEVQGYLGSLSFNKVDQRANGLGGAEFSLTHAADCACGDVEISIPNATSASGSGLVEFTDIPSGHTYILKEESAPAGFEKNDETYAVTVSYGTVSVAGVNDMSLFQIVNERTPNPPLVAIDVVKVIEGVENVDLQMMPTFTFQLTGDTINETVTGTVTGEGTVTLAEIQYGKEDAGKTFTYTVKEIPPEEVPQFWTYDGTEHTVEVTVTKNEYNEYSAVVLVDGEESNAVTITNEYYEPKHETGIIELTKYTNGDAATPESASFQLEMLVDNDWIAIGEPVTYDDFVDGKYIFGDDEDEPKLEVGFYRVVEDAESAAVEFYDLTVSEDNASVELKEVTAANGDTAVSKGEVSITNTYKMQEGSLKIVKTVEGADLMPADAKFLLKQGDEVIRTIRWDDARFVKEGNTGTITITGIPVGEYTLEEVDAENEETQKYHVLSVEDKEQTVVIVKSDEPATAEIKNTYTEKKNGTLTIEKLFSGVESISEDISFTITYPNGSKETVRYGEFNNGNKHTITNLQAGTYTVTENEKSAEIDGYELTVTANGADSNSAEVQLTPTGEETVTITNKYAEEIGYLTITKTIYGLEEGAVMEPSTRFEVKDAKSGETVAEATWAEFENGSKTFELPIGEYIVVETGAEIDGYEMPNEPAVIYNGKVDAESVEIEMDATAEAEVINSYKKIETEFYYYVVHEYYYSENGGAYKPVGKNEPVKCGPVAKAPFRATVFNRQVKAEDFEGETYARADEYASSEVYTNGESLQSNNLIYTVKYYRTDWTEGTLTITKTIKGLDSKTENDLKRTLKFRVTGPEGYDEIFSFVEDFSSKGKLTLKGLEPGTYTVEEIGAEIGGGYKLTVTGDQEVEVKAGKGAKCDIVNEYFSCVYNIWFDGGKHGDVLNTNGKSINGLWRGRWHEYKTEKKSLFGGDFDWAFGQLKPGTPIYKYGNGNLYPDLVYNPEVEDGTEMVVYTFTFAQWAEHGKKMGISAPDLEIDKGWTTEADYYVVGADEEILFTTIAAAVEYMNEEVEPDENGFYNVLYRPDYERDIDDDDDDDDDDYTPPVRIPDEDPPLVDIPDVEIPDELIDLGEEEVPLVEIPETEVPKTGDEVMLYVFAAAASAMGLAYLAITGKKREEEAAE